MYVTRSLDMHAIMYLVFNTYVAYMMHTCSAYVLHVCHMHATCIRFFSRDASIGTVSWHLRLDAGPPGRAKAAKSNRLRLRAQSSGDRLLNPQQVIIVTNASEYNTNVPWASIFFLFIHKLESPFIGIRGSFKLKLILYSLVSLTPKPALRSCFPDWGCPRYTFLLFIWKQVKNYYGFKKKS